MPITLEGVHCVLKGRLPWTFTVSLNDVHRVAMRPPQMVLWGSHPVS
jgi:hypothetical protein